MDSRIKVVFLDVDGVLNCRDTTTKNPHGCLGVDTDKCERLRGIVDVTESYIVLSSTWRLYGDLLPYLWRELGADMQIRYIGDTPDLRGSRRGLEIKEWVDRHPICERFIILDDDTDMDPLMSHLFYCDHRIGLTDEIVTEAIVRLNAPTAERAS